MTAQIKVKYAVWGAGEKTGMGASECTSAVMTCTCQLVTLKMAETLNIKNGITFMAYDSHHLYGFVIHIHIQTMSPPLPPLRVGQHTKPAKAWVCH